MPGHKLLTTVIISTHWKLRINLVGDLFLNLASDSYAAFRETLIAIIFIEIFLIGS